MSKVISSGKWSWDKFEDIDGGYRASVIGLDLSTAGSNAAYSDSIPLPNAFNMIRYNGYTVQAISATTLQLRAQVRTHMAMINPPAADFGWMSLAISTMSSNINSGSTNVDMLNGIIADQFDAWGGYLAATQNMLDLAYDDVISGCGEFRVYFAYTGAMAGEINLAIDIIDATHVRGGR